VICPAYVAGIIDGEGSIYSRDWNNPHVSVSNTSKALIDELGYFGGHTHVRNRKRSIGNLQAWDWIICGEKAAIMLRSCLPYLLIKRGKAVTALALWDAELGTNHRYHAARARAAMLPLLNEAWLAEEIRCGMSGSN
jgi:hypothetical protein